MSGKILIVDREPQTVRRAQAAAKAAGMSAVVASTTAYALELLANERPDVALFDLTARDGSWVSLVRTLRELDPEIAILATITHPSMELVMEAMRHRIADVLEKPIAEEQLAAAIRRIQQARASVSPSAAIDVVLVDDDPMTLSFASRQLSARGVITRTVASVKAARQEIAGRRPEVVVLDVVLAGETGLDLLPELAAATPPIPAILITASADPGIAIKGLRGGAFAAFPKPLEWDAIYRSIVTARRWVARAAPGPSAAPRATASAAAAAPAPVAIPARVVPPPEIFQPQYHVLTLAAPPPPPAPEPALAAEPPPVTEPPPAPVPEPMPAPFRAHCHAHFDLSRPVEIYAVAEVPAPAPEPAPPPAEMLSAATSVPGCPLADHSHCHVHYLETAPPSCEAVIDTPVAAAAPPPPEWHPELHVERLESRPAAEPIAEPEPTEPAPTAPAPEPERPPAPLTFHPHCHAHFVQAQPLPEAILEHEAAVMAGEVEPEVPVELPPPPPSFRVRTHCHLHFADSRPDQWPLPHSRPPPALHEAQELADDSDQASQALARAALALASLPSGILVLDARPAVVELNPAAEELLSLPRDRALDGGRDELPHLVPFFDAARLVLDSGNGRFHQEASLVLPRGPRTMGFGAVPLQKGQREGVLIYFQDITTRRAAATQRRKTERLASLGLIAAGLTAELADPISMASTYADLIMKEATSVDRCHHHAGRLRTALTRTTQLSSYVTTLLHRPVSEPGPVEMHDVISGVAASLQRKMLLGNHAAELNLTAQVSVVMGEAIDFEHLLMTLLVSCHQAVPQGGSLNVSTRNHTGIFEMVIETREPGIDATDPGGGPAAAPADAGPALEICRSLVKRYGGAIRIDTDTRATRRFIVRMLPARAEECTGWAVMGVAAPPLSTHHVHGESPVGLLIPDEATAAQCDGWLVESGLYVLSYASTDEALASIASDSPAVMVLQGPPEEGRWLQFLKRASEAHRTALLSLLDQSVSPRLQADLDELAGHRSLRWPVERLALLQAVALAELEGLDLQDSR